ncbi:formylglycine-generating enzyme family protein [Aestuariibaculum sediminum]|uniref:SUMF1/EgtB/PvdO family nonheme iron enzyme n=1 Tax=Aestuariibaculum sediminum TaxID=2770637 RepID=A0A8J6QA11_9FLAO|nr:SUMF1/EgtB/PvdO family nonheme iron enzyme [Aestuariibaculum sediminum]MBD0832947.1 SUMF1/EgtB/PvdO family nonheme iron enzyme [Aestuariibaculum sediminum]
MKQLLIILLFVWTSNYNLFAQAEVFQSYSQSVPGTEIAIELVAVSGGTFNMGNANGNLDEQPVHKVSVNDLWMGKYEITWEQYDAFVYATFEDSQFQDKSKLEALGIDAISGATPPYVDMSFNMGKGTHPAVNMTQYAALMFCKWLTSKTGIFYRLPTEAEWEYVCKTSNTKKDNLNDISWYDGNSEEKYHETGSKSANNLGIYDLLGNVSEWVLDQYDENYYKNSTEDNPWNKPTKLYSRVLRGGSWKDTSDKICCTSRQASNPKWKRRDPQIPKSNWWHTDAPFIGFRVVRPKIQPSKEEIKTYWLKAIPDF